MAAGFFDLSAQKSTKQAILFYVVCIVGTALAVAVCSSIMYQPPPEAATGNVQESFNQGFARGMANGQKIGPYINSTLSLLLSFLSIHRKNLYTPKAIGCALLGIVPAIFVGSLGGMIVPAYLTTQPAVKES